MSEKQPLFTTRTTSEASWLSVADMMSGLMMIFLLIAVLYIAKLRVEYQAVQGVSDNICSELSAEFQKEKEEWNMSICEGGLLISFQDDSVFERGQYKLKQEFKDILDVFFPRFMKIVMNNSSDISELRIEGHTSSEFTRTSKNNSYLLNTKLSQNRSYSVMNYVFRITRNVDMHSWMRKNLTAHGLSSSKLVYKKNSVDSKIEDSVRSRRVEFKIQTNAQQKFIDQFNNSVKTNNGS